MASPPFSINESIPAASDLISQHPAGARAFRDTVESWLNTFSDSTTGLLKAAGFPATLDVSSTITSLTLPGFTMSGDLVYSGTTTSIRANTLDGADTKSLILDGGGSGSATRGAFIALYGNEHATQAGNLVLGAGSAGTIQLSSTVSGTVTFSDAITMSSSLTVSGAFTSLGIDDNATAERVQIADTVTHFGTSGANYTIANAAADGILFLAGGTASNVGATLRLYGQTQATGASDWFFQSDGSTSRFWDHSASTHFWYAPAGTLRMSLTTSALQPGSNDGTALGAAGTGWSDLHLASGGVINWASSTYTLTQSGSNLTGSGSISAGSHLITSSGVLRGSASQMVVGTLGPTGDTGTVYLRPQGYNSATNQATLASNGVFTVPSLTSTATVSGTVISASTAFRTADGSLAAPGFAFTDATNTGIFRNASGEIEFSIAGTSRALITPAKMAAANFEADTMATGDLQANTSTIGAMGGTSLDLGTFSSTGATAGKQMSATLLDNSRTETTTVAHLRFFNPNGEVGSITTNASATAYNTSSDERLKVFYGELDPDAAIDVIRRDPARVFKWKKTGERAVGWGAQTSYAVSPDLASYDDEKDWWGMDKGNRTPYLWAAMSAVLDRLEALEAAMAERYTV